MSSNSLATELIERITRDVIPLAQTCLSEATRLGLYVGGMSGILLAVLTFLVAGDPTPTPTPPLPI